MTKALDSDLNAARSTLVKCGSILTSRSVVVLIMAVAGCLGEAFRPSGAPNLAVQADTSQLITTVEGSVGLSQGEQTGEFYVIDRDPVLGASFASIDAAFAAGNSVPVAVTISAEGLGLVGATLPTVLNLIILHAADGVKAYQVIRVTIASATF